jgi:prepilin-type processing-associated H-X9-DG protein
MVKQTKREIIILLFCVVFVLLNIGAIGSSGRRRAKEMVCLSNLRQWGFMFEIYCGDNDGYFFTGEVNGTRAGVGSGEFWRATMRPYIKAHSEKILLCPQAVKPPSQGGIPQGNWSVAAWRASDDTGSYGLNGWVLNIKASSQPGNRTNGWGRTPVEWHWGTSELQNANNVPVFTGSWWVDSWPRETDLPPTEDGPAGFPITNEMNRDCVDRHNGAVNMLFMDWSARKTGLKELWTLKWHREFIKNGPWTVAGGVLSGDWPEWMRNFKDY